VTRRGFGAEDAVTPFDDVQVNLEDAPLVPREFEHRGDDEFLRLAQITLLRGQEEVLRQLLGDRAATLYRAAAAYVLLVSFLHRIPVDAFVRCKASVLRGDDRPLQLIRDTLIRQPLLAQGRRRVLGMQAF